MNRTITVIIALIAMAACNSPASLKLDPEVLTLEGAGAKGRIGVTILDQDGRPMADGPGLAWLPTNPEVATLQQDGEVIARSTGTSMYEVEVVGTEVRAQGRIVINIPVSVGVSEEEVALAPGRPGVEVTAQVFADTGAPIPGLLAAWKVEDPAVAGIEQLPDAHPARSRARLTAKGPGETWAIASYKELAADVRVVVTAPDGEEPAAP